MDFPAGPLLGILSKVTKHLSERNRGFGVKINSDDVVALERKLTDEDTPFVGWLGSRADEGRG